MKIRIAKDPKTWNAIVDRSPYSVLHHRYESHAFIKNALPLIIKERGHYFLFPLSIMKFLKAFSLAVSPFHFNASILPDTEEALDLMPSALDHATDFLKKIQVDYLSSCAPAFWPKRYVTLLNTWFRRHKASIQTIYAYIIWTGNTTFEEIWKHRFKRRVKEGIRKAEREGVSVIKIDTVDRMHAWMDEIYQCTVSALKRQGRWGAYPDSYKEVYSSELISTKRLLKQYFNVYGAIYRGRLIAYMIVQEYNKLMAPTKGASLTKFLRKSPNDVLLAHLLKEACERGFRWFEYGSDRVRRGGKISSLYPGLQMWRNKFGFDEVPMPIYRLGLTASGRMIQHLYSSREYVVTRSAYIPQSVRSFLLKSYAPRRRKLSVFLHV